MEIEYTKKEISLGCDKCQYHIDKSRSGIGGVATTRSGRCKKIGKPTWKLKVCPYELK